MSNNMLQCLTMLEKQIKELKVEISKETEKKSMTVEKTIDKKPKKIEECTKREQLNKYFTIAELKEWLKKKKINVKKVNEKHKNDFVKIVWENISDDSSSGSDECSDSDDSDHSEDEEWEYYYA